MVKSEHSNTSEISPLPAVYNMTYIYVLVRDPFWIFAIWEISSHDKEKYEKQRGFCGWRLRIRTNNTVISSTDINEFDTRYIHFSQKSVNGELYFAELCAITGDTEIVIAKSVPFEMPRSLPEFGSDEYEAMRTPINILSGIDDIDVARGSL